ncbi:BTAD domain-containing putative transcriptional regulator [Actinoplanes sp. CA-030573]|uniref:BTAD domain-containing putative transcriptional regulator n=1 Tax=Actinoplanes sp. CA-030573 TaxID=3239898 RepID=UPI003D913EE0
MISSVRVTPFGDLLRTYRKRVGLTQEVLARHSGLSTRAIRDLENNRVSAPHARSLDRLALALRLSAEETARLAPTAAGVPPPVRVAVLGPVTVTVGGRSAPIASAHGGAVLTLLALRLGEVVPREEIAGLLWPDEPRPAATALLRSAVSRLRRTMPGDDGPLQATRQGLSLRLERAQVDAARFAGLVARAEGRRSAEARANLLREALDCWRGPMLADAPAAARDQAAVQTLRERRVAAAIEYSVEAGPAAIDVLRTVAADEPLHEPLHAALMTALAGSGDRAAALRQYGKIARGLADELGVAPGARLVAAYRQVVTDAGGRRPWVRPAQLPREVRFFAGREEQLAALGAGSGISIVVGAPGSGKTALAVQWAHGVRDAYPDGQLFADLGGFGAGEPARPESVLRGFLQALGVPAAQISSGFEARSALFRSLLADRRVLVVLDNVRSAEHVRPLLPGAGGSRVVITSRDRLRELIVTAEAQPIAVGPLTEGQARELLTHRLGAQRVDAEPEAVTELVTRCAGLPLALHVVAAQAATVPLTAAAAQLGTHRLDELRAAFSWSCRGLTTDALRLLRLSATVPAPEFSVLAAASLIGRPAQRTRAAVDELVRGHLIEEGTAGRYTTRELLREYARGLPGPADAGSAARRLLAHYVHTAIAAARLLDPYRPPIDLPPAADEVVVDPPGDVLAARDWFAAEHGTLLAALDRAVAEEFDAAVIRLAWSLRDHLDRPGRRHDWHRVARAALAVALRTGDRAAQAQAHHDLGQCCLRLGRRPDAEFHLRRAVQLARSLGDPVGHAEALLGLAGLAGEPDEALRHRLMALALYRRAGYAAGEARALGAVAGAYVALGSFLEAVDYGRRALTLSEQLGDERGRADLFDILGDAHRHLGEYAEAVRHRRRAAELRRAHGEPEPLVAPSTEG